MSGPMHKLDPLSEILDDEDMQDDPDVDEARIVWEKVTEFRGSVSSSRIDGDGQLHLTVKVPFEDKYLALPVTDIRGVLMVFGVFKPRPVEATSAD